MIHIPSRDPYEAVGCHVFDVSHRELKAQEASIEDSSLEIQAVKLWRFQVRVGSVLSGPGFCF